MVDDEPVLTGDPHPETWDLICVGTGLAETMLAGCAPHPPASPRLGTPAHPFPSPLPAPRPTD